jgi:hypothetical protein
MGVVRACRESLCEARTRRIGFDIIELAMGGAGYYAAVASSMPYHIVRTLCCPRQELNTVS